MLHYMPSPWGLQVMTLGSGRGMRAPTGPLQPFAAAAVSRYLTCAMSQTPPDWNNAWQGLEPQQPRHGRGGCYGLAIAAVLILGVGVLALAYVAISAGGTAEPDIVLPGEEATAVADATPPPEGQPTAETGPGVAPTVTLPGDAATPQLPPAASAVTAGRFSPSVDGDPTEWSALPVYSSPHIVYTDDTWDGTDDLAVTWQVAWDDIYLYLVAVVVDDTHSQSQAGSQAFLGDSIELQIDTAREGDNGTSLSPDDFQISLSPGDFSGLPASAWLFQGTPDGSMRDAAAAGGIIVTARPTGDGYTLEAAISWSNLGITPAPGQVIGLAVNANDNDRPGTAAQELMKSNVPGRRFSDPTTWGTLTLQ